MKKIRLLFFIVICLSAGAVGSVFTSSSVNSWYRTLNKPFFNPPSWVFAPVWTLLYVVMGISLFLAWSHKNVEPFIKKKAILIFGIQLFLNILWSAFFFGLQNPLLAFIEIILLWLAIAATIISFAKISELSAYLLVPYLIWVSFAAILNYSIALLN